MPYAENRNRSRNILIQMVVIFALLLGLGFYFSDVIRMIYFSNQQTTAGYALNGFIIFLFLVGMIRIILLLLHYSSEESCMGTFRRNMDQQRSDLLDGIAPNTMIARRYETMENMHLQQAPIHHQVLASTLLATESSRTAIIRFIHNILILCGVLGTIISLSIALFGASTLLEQAVSSSGMGMVIHGMSTALSTTMSAIICYLIMAYFYTALQNVQSHILADIEHFTSTRLMPRFQSSAANIESHAVDLVSQAQLLVRSLHDYFEALNPDALTERIEQAANKNAELSQRQHAELLDQIRKTNNVLKDGFRLPKV